MRYADFRSDTVTMPTKAMRKAMAEAVVGDNVFDDDPTVTELEQLAAKTLGKEAALFVASGTQGNSVALMSQTRRGDAVIMSRICHIADHEAGSYALLSGVSPCFPAEDEGVLDPGSVAALIQDGSDYMAAPTGLICLENALSNGNVAPVENFAQIHAVAKARGIPVHLDGARLFNAAASLGVDVKDLTKHCDTVMCCLSKGLCAPVGSVVAGSREFIAKAWKWRKILGGGMRQAGVLAAAGILSLTEMTKRVGEDNANARYLAEQLLTVPGVSLDLEKVKVNMLFFGADWPAPVKDSLADKLLERGFKVLSHEMTGGQFRLLTNNDVTRTDCDALVAAIRELTQ